jgi:hypothetical protein
MAVDCIAQLFVSTFASVPSIIMTKADVSTKASSADSKQSKRARMTRFLSETPNTKSSTSLPHSTSTSLQNGRRAFKIDESGRFDGPRTHGTWSTDKTLVATDTDPDQHFGNRDNSILDRLAIEEARKLCGENLSAALDAYATGTADSIAQMEARSRRVQVNCGQGKR